MFSGFGISNHIVVNIILNNKLITIVIPTYNRASVISRTLNSVLSQTFLDWECLVVDDYSTDNTREVIEEYCKKDPRFCYLVNEGKKGAQGARNTGLKHAQNDWVVFFDSDDVMHSDMLESMAAAIGEFKKQYDVFTCFSNIVSTQSGEIVGKFEWQCEGNIHDQLFTGECYVDYNGAVIRKKSLLEMGALDEDCPSMQEWDTHIRLSRVATYHTVPKVLIDYYVGGKDAISSNSRREVIGRLYILKKHKKEWRKHKKCRTHYIKEILSLIQQHPSQSFRAKATCQLILYAPSVLWVFLKRCTKRYLHKTK